MFIRFDVIHERDGRTNGQTDRQTLRDSIDRACIASRGKNSERQKTAIDISILSVIIST